MDELSFTPDKPEQAVRFQPTGYKQATESGFSP